VPAAGDGERGRWRLWLVVESSRVKTQECSRWKWRGGLILGQNALPLFSSDDGLEDQRDDSMMIDIVKHRLEHVIARARAHWLSAACKQWLINCVIGLGERCPISRSARLEEAYRCYYSSALGHQQRSRARRRQTLSGTGWSASEGGRASEKQERGTLKSRV
jgi:hypothetical protein